MALYLTEEDVQRLLPMDRAMACVEASLRGQHTGEGVNQPRKRILLPQCSLHYMAAALPDEKMMGLKIYTITRSAFRFIVLLYDSETGELLALIEADHLGRIRTGAASGVATKYMAWAGASRVGLIGTGRQARTQLEAVAAARKLSRVAVFGREKSRRQEFCREMSERLGLEISPAESAETAVRGSDIVITATNSREPVLRGDWLEAGTHINAIGANMIDRRELDDATIAAAGLIAVDSVEQAKTEAGDLVYGLPSAGRNWQTVRELHEVVAGKRTRASADEITLFKSCGIALWDVAVGGYVYREAKAKGVGQLTQIL